jgi:hypothetical protein
MQEREVVYTIMDRHRRAFKLEAWVRAEGRAIGFHTIVWKTRAECDRHVGNLAELYQATLCRQVH